MMEEIRNMMRFVTLALALLSAWMALPVAAQPLPGEPFPIVAEFATSPPSAVTVDVLELPAGTQVGDDLAATQVTRDANSQALWRFDLSSVTGFPTDCTQKTYLVTWVPDATDCSVGASPTACASQTIEVGGTACAMTGAVSPDFYHTSTVVSAQGITQTVIDYYGRRGQLPIKWRHTRVATDGDHSSPDFQWWDVYFYTIENQIPRICTVSTTSDPASALPTETCH